ncbi:MAG: YbjQ family protein [Ferruginibacter sp.]
MILTSFKIKDMIDQNLITTANTLEGYRIIKHIGVIRGITVRSRSIFGNIAGGFQTLVGGKLSIYVELCEKTREEAYQLMIQHANERGANAIINMRYDANEVMNGVTEVLAYGTAVVVEKI